MAGSIRQRADRGPDAWELRVFVGRDARGRVRHRSITFRGTKRAAERELARLVTEQELTPAVVPEGNSRTWGSTSTINDALSAWQETAGRTSAPRRRSDT